MEKEVRREGKNSEGWRNGGLKLEGGRNGPVHDRGGSVQEESL